MGKGGEAEKTNLARKPVVHLESAEWTIASDDDRHSQRHARAADELHAELHRSSLL